MDVIEMSCCLYDIETSGNYYFVKIYLRKYSILSLDADRFTYTKIYVTIFYLKILLY